MNQFSYISTLPPLPPQPPPKTITVTRRSTTTASGFISDEAHASDGDIDAIIDGLGRFPVGWVITKSGYAVQWMWDLTNEKRVEITVFRAPERG